MKRPSLRSRIRTGTLVLLGLSLVVGLFGLAGIHRMGDALRLDLHRGYQVSRAARHMNEVLWQLEAAPSRERLIQELPESWRIFTRWQTKANSALSGKREPVLAGEIGRRSAALFEQLAAGELTYRQLAAFALLHRRLDELAAAASERDDLVRALSDRLAAWFLAGLGLLLMAGSLLAWALGWIISRPLRDLAADLHGISRRRPLPRLGSQPLAELDLVAQEFNQMAEELDRADRLNVESLLYEKSKIEAVVESLEDGVVLIDSRGIVTHINEIATIILGVEKGEALGSSFDDLSTASPHYLRVRDALRALGKATETGRRTEVQLHVRGRSHCYLLKPIPLRADEGPPLGTILLLQDVTYLRDQERSRTNLLARLSHELQAPLDALAFAAGLLARSADSLESKQREVIAAIADNVKQLRQIEDSLLSLARGEMAAIALERSDVEVAPLIASVMKTFALQAEEKTVELDTRDVEGELRLRADPVKLTWTISNLVGNALRYTPAGGKVRVSAARTNSAVLIQVIDGGPGIAPEIRDRLLERVRHGASDGTLTGSTGLGLAIVKEIVEAHGGRIFIDSAPDRGTCVRLEIPIP